MLCHYVTKNGEQKKDLNKIGCLRADVWGMMEEGRGKREEGRGLREEK